MRDAVKLGLGSAQFGLDYGVSNREGMTSEDEVRRILGLASGRGVKVIDTARAYGRSQEVLGRCLPPAHGFDIVTKIAPMRTASISRDQLAGLAAQFEQSLTMLRQERVYGLLAHHAGDVLAEGGEGVVDALRALQARGLVNKIGVSVYDARELDCVLARWTPDIVQLPLSVLDQRLIASGHVAQIARLGVEIHVRSVFLQGLLLMAPQAIPAPLQGAARGVAEFQAFAAAGGCSPAGAALQFAAALPGVRAVLAGVNNAAQLEELLDYGSCAADTFAMARFALTDEALLNPARWRLQ